MKELTPNIYTLIHCPYCYWHDGNWSLSTAVFLWENHRDQCALRKIWLERQKMKDEKTLLY